MATRGQGSGRLVVERRVVSGVARPVSRGGGFGQNMGSGRRSGVFQRSDRSGARMAVEVIEDASGLEPHVGGAFVPTMGALHEGHLHLVRRAAELGGEAGRPVVVSIFVNPTQFGPGEDFEQYPRQRERDIELARDAGATVIFAPDVETVYPPGEAVDPPALPPVATEPGLEDAHRPGHFSGVCQVVARLFDLVRPGWAVFGEKDYQQLLVIRSMVERERPRWGELEIVGERTVRESDGLAMSSRNAYLSAEQRERALGLSRALQTAHAAQHPETAEQLMAETLAAHDLEVEYAVVRHAETLRAVSSLAAPARAMIAAKVDEVRLIDNARMVRWT